MRWVLCTQSEALWFPGICPDDPPLLIWRNIIMNYGPVVMCMAQECCIVVSTLFKCTGTLDVIVRAQSTDSDWLIILVSDRGISRPRPIQVSDTEQPKTPWLPQFPEFLMYVPCSSIWHVRFMSTCDTCPDDSGLTVMMIIFIWVEWLRNKLIAVPNVFFAYVWHICIITYRPTHVQSERRSEDYGKHFSLRCCSQPWVWTL